MLTCLGPVSSDSRYNRLLLTVYRWVLERYSSLLLLCTSCLSLRIHRRPKQTSLLVLSNRLWPLLCSDLFSFVSQFVALIHIANLSSSIDGLSIPFFSFGRNLSRTVSLSTTFTPRFESTTPDWLLWARRTPANHRSSKDDVEISGAESASEPGEGHIHVSSEANTEVRTKPPWTIYSLPHSSYRMSTRIGVT